LRTSETQIIVNPVAVSLASKQGLEVVEYLRKCSHEENRCVIIASHDERIIGYADRVLHLRDRELKQNNSASCNGDQ
jgi:putative ABC transport system ATP-binding protein